VVTPTQARAAVDFLAETYSVSERRASQLLDRPRSSIRYQPKQRAEEKELVKSIRRLARKHRRFGYRKIHVLLKQDAWEVNVKRVRRLWNELGLRVRQPRKKPRKGGRAKGTSANSCVNQPARFKNDVRTYDFVASRQVDGRPLKWLTLVDEYTRECLTLHVSNQVVGADVRRVLAQVIGRRGAPRRLRSDNGSEFVCAVLQGWLPQAGVASLCVAPGSPWENGFIESFNSRFRDEFLNGTELETVSDAKAQADGWRREYNRIRPHGALDYQTPQAFSDECDEGRHGQPAKKTKDNK